MIDVDVHRERRHRAPPFARDDAARVEPPRAEPVEVEHALVQAHEHGKQDHDVRGDARQRTPDLLDAPLPDRPLVLGDVLGKLAARLRRARHRNPDLPTRAAGRALMLDSDRDQHEPELGRALLVRDGRDRDPLFCLVFHLC